jgi:2,4-didehydro-3-deoxy-L-rhamnonate hydrolase
MKLIRFGEQKKEKPGILTKDGIRKDCSHIFKDWDHSFFKNNGLEKLKKLNLNELPNVTKDKRWGAPVARPFKVICIGLNYKEHTKEAKMDIPTEPIVFLKATNSIVGPYDDITIPKNSTTTDYELELGIIIGKDCYYLESSQMAEEYIAGYTISNDVSERNCQLKRSGQWCKGKSFKSFNPIGPFLLTSDEIDDPNDLNMYLKVNSDIRQKSNTKNMIFDPTFIVHYVSQFMELEAGDLITTGTPSGVALGLKYNGYLKQGDELELGIDKLGVQKSICINYTC